MASLGVPAYGYGIRYDHGLFRQIIKDGWQEEFPEEWLSFRNPWEFERSEVTYDANFGGWVETVAGRSGHERFVWHPEETIEAVAYDTPVVGWRGAHVNPLRLWSARAVDPIRLEVFNRGDHVGALSEQARAEALSKILYPSDETTAGRELRLRQEYSLSRPRCRTSSSGIAVLTARSTPSPNGPPSSSTTPIRASPSPSLCGTSSISTTSCGTTPGRSPSIPAGIPTTHCSPKRSKAGRWRCSSGFCRAICRSST
jgi:hypothetical protein